MTDTKAEMPDTILPPLGCEAEPGGSHGVALPHHVGCAFCRGRALGREETRAAIATWWTAFGTLTAGARQLDNWIVDSVMNALSGTLQAVGIGIREGYDQTRGPKEGGA